MFADQQDGTSPSAGHVRRAYSRAVATTLLSLAAALGAGPVAAQATKPAPPAAPAAPVKLDTVTARRGDIQQTVDAAGTLQLRKWADVYAQIGGQVKEVSVAIGDTVQAD